MTLPETFLPLDDDFVLFPDGTIRFVPPVGSVWSDTEWRIEVLGCGPDRLDDNELAVYIHEQHLHDQDVVSEGAYSRNLFTDGTLTRVG